MFKQSIPRYYQCKKRTVMMMRPHVGVNPDIIRNLKFAYNKNIFEKRSLRGEEIKTWIVEKWGRLYHVDLLVRGNAWFLEIMDTATCMQCNDCYDCYERYECKCIETLHTIGGKLADWFMIENVEDELNRYDGPEPIDGKPVYIRVCKSDKVRLD